MTSKEVLKRIEEELYLILPKNIRQELIGTIKQDLERLDKLEKEKTELLLAHSKVLKDFSDTNQYTLDIIKENIKLKQALKKALDIIKGNIVSKKRIQSLRETANPLYEVVLHIPQNVLKEVFENE